MTNSNLTSISLNLGCIGIVQVKFKVDQVRLELIELNSDGIIQHLSIIFKKIKLYIYMKT